MQHLARSQGPRSYKYTPREWPGHLVPGSSRSAAFRVDPGSEIIGHRQLGVGVACPEGQEGSILGSTRACLPHLASQTYTFLKLNVSSKARLERKQKGNWSRGWRGLGGGL